MKTKYLKSLPTIALLFIFSSTFGQTIVEGVIKNKENHPLESANILLRGTKYNAVSDANGKFSIDTHDKLPFGLIIVQEGYKTVQLEYTELPKKELQITLAIVNQLNDVVITSRRRIEKAQNVPIAVSVIGGRQAEIAGAFNVNRLKELEKITGNTVRGMAYPFGSYDNLVVETINGLGIEYARTVSDSYNFSIPSNFLI